jgi:hypothetical protein
MRETGRRTNNMATDKRLGLMRQSTRDNIKMEKNMAREISFGRTIVAMKVNFSKITSMVLGNTSGKTEESTKVSGRTTKCKAKESLLGLMEGDMRDSTRMTRNRDSECLPSEMVEFMRVSGKMENKTVKESSRRRTS